MDKNNVELKKKYKTDFEKVRLLINEFDPCGLICSGSPIDEYDSLTNLLLSSFYTDKSRNEIKKIFLYEIDHYFGTPELETLKEPNKSTFNNKIDDLLDKLKKQIAK